MNDSVNKMADMCEAVAPYKPEDFKEVVESFYSPSHKDGEIYVYNNTTTFYKKVVGEMTKSFMKPDTVFDIKLRRYRGALYCYSGSFMLWCALHAIGIIPNWYYRDIDVFIHMPNPYNPPEYNEFRYYKIINHKKVNVIETAHDVESIFCGFDISCCKISFYKDQIMISQECIYALLTGLNISGRPQEIVLLSGERVINITSERAEQIQYIIDNPCKIFNDKKYCDNKTSNVMTTFKNIYFIDSKQFNECVEHNGVRWCIKQDICAVSEYVNFVLNSDFYGCVDIKCIHGYKDTETLGWLFDKYYATLTTMDEEEQIAEKIKQDLRSMLYYGHVPERIIRLIKIVNMQMFYKWEYYYDNCYYIYHTSILKYKRMLKYKSRGFRFYKRGYYV